jgi:crotonobetainyl-CoA:carnitine CoA-transferase CaiB-like acyl-CoA transferase
VPVREPVELIADDEALRHKIVRPDPRPGRDGRWTAGRVAFFDRDAPLPTSSAPRLGEHSTDLLAEAGIGPREVADLIAAGVVVQWEPRSG